MTAPELLATLHARGVRVRVVGDRLRLAPPEALDEALIAEARRLKPDLLRLLAPGVSAPAECGWCGAALAAFLLDLPGRPALLCPSCRQWTMAGGAA